MKRIFKTWLQKVAVDKHGFEYTVRELTQMYESSRAAQSWHGDLLTDTNFQYKNSDTIFILGSGPSINLISDRQWEQIARNDSVGFNFWLAHKFVPDFYLLQFPSNRVYLDGLFTLLKDKQTIYKNVPFILRGSILARKGIDTADQNYDLLKQHMLYYINEYPIHSSCSINPAMLYRYVEALGIFNFGEIGRFVPKWRGTLGLLISLAYQMGYKKIVLCGMDMSDSSHFWDHESYTVMKKNYELPAPGVSNIQTFTNEKHSSNTVPKYVYTLRDWMYEKNGVEIMVANSQTVLYPTIPLYQFQNT